ncbi:hypothetical protein QBC47DRAFT_390381, partial [Echria macrotheca]
MGRGLALFPGVFFLLAAVCTRLEGYYLRIDTAWPISVSIPGGHSALIDTGKMLGHVYMYVYNLESGIWKKVRG